jgi:hypothetical protein
MNIISETASSVQLEKLGVSGVGSDIQGVQDLRGILVEWGGRLLGRPYFKTGKKEILGYSHSRNMRSGRAVMSIEGDSDDRYQAKHDTVAALKIQSNKHNINLDDCSYMIRYILALTYGTMVYSYSSTVTGLYGKDKFEGGCTGLWILDQFIQNMKTTWLPKPKVKKEKPTTAEQVNSGDESSTANSSVAPLIDTFETNVSISENTETKEIYIMEGNLRKYSIPFRGQFFMNKKILISLLKSMGNDETFLAYAQGLEELNRLHLV